MNQVKYLLNLYLYDINIIKWWNISETKLKLDILKHSERLSNPVWTKQSKQALLHLKQRHPSCFQDVCMFSEICNMIGTMTYRLSARRFLQELFLDLNFDELLSEPNEILKEKVFEEQTAEHPDENNKTETVKATSRASGELVQRCNELSDVVRSHRTPNSIKASDTNRNVTRGFSVDIRARGVDEVRATSPLTSVEEEPIVLQITENTNKKETTFIIRTNTLEGLRLTCSENKFPITNRVHTPTITRTWSYGSKSMRSPITKQSSFNQNVTSPPPSLPNNIPSSKLAETWILTTQVVGMTYRLAILMILTD